MLNTIVDLNNCFTGVFSNENMLLKAYQRSILRDNILLGENIGEFPVKRKYI